LLAGQEHGRTIPLSEMRSQRRRSSAAADFRILPLAYLLLLATQIAGAIIFVWQELPEFEQLLRNPGEQLPKDIRSDLIIVGVFSVMQISFWCRLLYVPIPFRRANLFLNHLFYF
jgi:hypothetical protein